MHGTRIFWKKSRIFRIIAVIISLPFLFASLLLWPALPVSADGNPVAENFELTTFNLRSSWAYFDPVPISYDSSNPGSKYRWYRDVNVYYEIALSPRFDRNYFYGGFIRFGGTLDIEARLAPRSGSTVSDLNIGLVEIIDISCLSGNRIGNYSTYTQQYFVETGQVRRNFIQNFNILYYFYEWDNSHTSIFDTICCKYRIYFENAKGTGYSGELAVADNVDITQQNISRVRSDNYYLYNINENIKSSVNSLSGAIVNAINNASSTAHTDSISEKNAINSAAAQAHSDAMTIDDHIMNDHSNFSSNVDSAKSEFESQEAIANAAMDNSVHNYSAQLATVSDMDFDNFWTNQSNTAIFWRDVGEFILDPSNLGMFAGGLVIVSVMTLFVFMLRL